MEWIKIQHST